MLADRSPPGIPNALMYPETRDLEVEARDEG